MERMICMENINVDKVFKEYGLEVQQVEPYVYRSLNINNEIDVEGLQADLMNCILITSRRLRFQRLEEGGSCTIAHIYYVIMDAHNRDLGHKYNRLATKEYGDSLYDSYEYRPELANSIDTIYATK